ncbi:dGTP triphosphohydrolase [Exiguobacterium sp. 22311]|uniref:dGTP triphosphohydrolase n=1 Tax=Exiguobacterium sp. 22311 TaxID=3453907 RepID=UPI003F860F84
MKNMEKEKEMEWNSLLNGDRRRVSKRDKKQKDAEIYDLFSDHRNEFERDYDRIMGSSSLRRLQDKAQVFPLQTSDFIRTRLTHSMEVSAIARSFGVWLDDWLLKNKKIEKDDLRKIPSILATAGLVHDIGNPPYGHYGEDIIKKWFKNYFEKMNKTKKNMLKELCVIKVRKNKKNNMVKSSKLNVLKSIKISSLENSKNILTPEQKNDFIHFDGNAQGLRILTRLQVLNDQYGINFTYGTLSVLLKYPYDSSNEIAKKKKKFGYFQQDKAIGEKIINETTKMSGKRNPLTYFLEAADDIAYLGADIEDGVKKKLIPWELVFEKLIKSVTEEGSDLYKSSEERLLYNEVYSAYQNDIDELYEKHKQVKKDGFPDYLLTSAQNFKAWVQGQIIKEVKSVFIKDYELIMQGKLKEDFISKTDNAKNLDSLLRSLLKDYVFCSREVLSLELVGDSVLSDLLNMFIKECITEVDCSFETDSRSKAGKLFKMISENFVFIHLMNDNFPDEKIKKTLKDLSLYEKLLLITDFISGMTDSYALDLHQKLKGVKMP